MIRRAAPAIATGALLALAGLLASANVRSSSVVLAIAAAFVPYALLLRAPIDRDPRRALGLASAIAALAGLTLVLSPPVLSDDLFRYLWDARVLGHGIDPYAHPPDDAALLPLRDALHARINHPSLATIYPPLAQIAFLLADRIAHAPWSIKLLALGAHLATGPVVARLARARAATLAPLFVLNPLALEEAALGGHIDALAALWLALAVLALGRSAPIRAALAIAAAAATKVVGLALAPLLFRTGDRRALALVLALGLSALALAPVATAGPRGAGGLGAYARSWRGNDGGFALLAEGARLAFDLAGAATGAPRGWIRLPFLAPLVAALDRTALDLHGPRPAKKEVQRPTSFETRQLGEFLARGLALAIVLAVARMHLRRGSRPLPAARDVLLALLLVSPQVHPWYLTWLLPLEIASGGVAGLAWSAAVLVAYAPLEGWIAHRVWTEAAAARVIEYLVVAAAMWAERRPRRDSSRSPVRSLARA